MNAQSHVPRFDWLVFTLLLLATAARGPAQCCPPVVTTQPTNQTVYQGTTVTFSVAVSSATFVTFQWRRNGANISGATSSNYTIVNVQAANAGTYSVAVTNAAGFAISSNATLTVTAPPAEDPPNCSLAHGGLGNTSQGGISFTVAQAHVGDTVTLTPSLGMVAGACRAINATGSVWVATGQLTNFLINVTLDPGALISCPANGLCRPGPYNLLLSPGLVGAAVSSPNGVVPGVPKAVRAVENGNGTVQTGAAPEQLSDFHTATIAVVTPCIQVVHQSAYPPGQNCFQGGQNINFTGYVTNCGDIRLTNVVVTGSRTGTLLGTNGLPLTQPLTLNVTQAIKFQGSYSPTVQEITSGSATNTVVVSGKDTTVIGGARASVTNTLTVVSLICNLPTITSQPVSQTVGAGSNATFSVTATGTMPLNYRWRFNGTNLASATSAILTVTNVQPTNAGNYSVLVSNAFGTATSANAALTVDATIRLSSYLWTTNGFQFRLTGPAGSYVIQASTNLMNWISLATNAAPNGVLEFTDTTTPVLSRRFYRAMLQ